MNIGFRVPLDIVKKYEIFKAEEGKEEKKESQWIVEGFCGTTDFDLSGDIITEEAFQHSEQDLLQNSTLLENHNTDKRVGRILETKSTSKGLWVKALISKTVPDIWKQIQEGVLNKFSIRGKVITAVKEYIKDLKRVANVIKEMYLIEASLVSLPANPEARTLGWYVSKALHEYEAGGGEIPKADNIKLQEKGVTKRMLEQLKNFIEKAELLDITGILELCESLKAQATDEEKVEIDSLIEKVKTKKDKFAKEEKPAEEKPAEEKPAEEKPAEEKPAEEKPAEEKPAEEKPAEEKPAEEKPAEAEGAQPNEGGEKPEGGEGKTPPVESVKNAYSKEEVDTLIAGIQAKVERQLKEALTKKDTEIKTLKTKVADLTADKKMAAKWSSLSTSYKDEDAEEIKCILLKQIKGEKLSENDTDVLVQKKISDSNLQLGSDIEEDMEKSKKAELIRLGGIKVRL